MSLGEKKKKKEYDLSAVNRCIVFTCSIVNFDMSCVSMGKVGNSLSLTVRVNVGLLNYYCGLLTW